MHLLNDIFEVINENEKIIRGQSDFTDQFLGLIVVMKKIAGSRYY